MLTVSNGVFCLFNYMSVVKYVDITLI